MNYALMTSTWDFETRNIVNIESETQHSVHGTRVRKFAIKRLNTNIWLKNKIKEFSS